MWDKATSLLAATITEIFVMLVFIYPVHALEPVCQANNIVGDTPPGMLSVTEFAITAKKIGCPNIEQDLGLDFPATATAEINVWYRLEGDQKFIESMNENSVFTAIALKDNIEENFSILQIERDRINRRAVNIEASINDGHFDWRMRANFTTPNIPGHYAVQLKFGGEPVCLSGPKCEIEFDVR